MALTSEQTNAIERLRENESLTDNLTDTDARALLDWAQNQIIGNADPKLVQAAVSAANASGLQGVQPLLAQASTFLAQQLAAHGSTVATTPNPPTSPPQPITVAPPSQATPGPAAPTAPSTIVPDTSPAASRPQASGQAGETSKLSAQANAAAGPATSTSAPPSPPPPPIKKSPRKPKRKKKTN